MPWILLIFALIAAALWYFTKNVKLAVGVFVLGLIIFFVSNWLQKKDENPNPDIETTQVGGTTIVADTCGCLPGQSARIYRKNIINKWKYTGSLPCAQALALTGKNAKKYQLRGCTT